MSLKFKCRSLLTSNVPHNNRLVEASGMQQATDAVPSKALDTSYSEIRRLHGHLNFSKLQDFMNARL